MIERDGSPVPITEPTVLQLWEELCPRHLLTYNRHLAECPECAAETHALVLSIKHRL